MTVPTEGDDHQPAPARTKWRMRLFQGVSIAGPAALTAYLPTLGVPLLVAAAVVSIWVGRSSMK